MEELGEGFFNEYTTDFYEYFDQHLVKNVVKKDEYKKISDEIKQIKKEYPNLVSLLEEQENVELSFKEASALNEIISLERELNIIELKEAFNNAIHFFVNVSSNCILQYSTSIQFPTRQSILVFSETCDLIRTPNISFPTIIILNSSFLLIYCCS